MIWLYLTIFLIGCGLPIRLGAWRSRHVITAGVGTALAAFAILAGFSIGLIIAPLALVVLASAAVPHLKP